MASIQRVRAHWTGFSGAPGLSTFYVTNGNSFLPDLRTFFNSIAGLLPSNVTISFDPFGDIINDSTGALTGAWAAGSTPATVTGSSGSVYIAPSGLVVNWQTGAIVAGRRLRGKTFLVPGPNGSADGTPTTANLATLSTAATTLFASTGGMLVWHRPNPVGSSTGVSSVVTAAQVPDKFVILRSRRD
jgi:hypothetical protein